MRKILLIIILAFFIINSITAQINISVDNSCLTKNSILLAQELIKNLGKDKVSELLDNNIRILLFFNVDSLGNMTLEKSKIHNKSANEFQDTSNNNTEKLTSDLNLDLKITQGYFSICYERLPNYNDSESIKLISQDLFEDNKKIIINVAFPGDLLIYYELEKEKFIREGKSITKYEYLENKINNSH